MEAGSCEPAADGSNSSQHAAPRKALSEDAAATAIQARYRSFRRRREKQGLTLTKPAWNSVLAQTEQLLRNSQFAGASAALSGRRRLQNAVHSAGLVGRGSADSDKAFILRTEHWLEATDVRHRYGSNLRPYHQFWLSQSTTQPFFFWLDYGEGRAVDLPQRPRAKLESEMLHYLTLEERRDVQVVVDDQGRLRYKRSGELVHTLDESEEAEIAAGLEDWRRAELFALAVKAQRKVEGAAVEDDVLEAAKARRNANKWIFVVSATGKDMYVAPKVKGEFQHSSFLSGGAISAAGSISVNRGTMMELSPLSGHYRPTLQQFLTLLDELSRQGVPLGQALLLNPFGPVPKCKYDLVETVLEDTHGAEDGEAPKQE